MATKTFIGTIDASNENNFSDSEGRLIECWRLAILLSDEQGLVFNIGKEDPIYYDAASAEAGQKVQVIAHSVVKNDGKVRWKLDDIKQVA